MAQRQGSNPALTRAAGPAPGAGTAAAAAAAVTSLVGGWRVINLCAFQQQRQRSPSPDLPRVHDLVRKQDFKGLMVRLCRFVSMVPNMCTTATPGPCWFRRHQPDGPQGPHRPAPCCVPCLVRLCCFLLTYPAPHTHTHTWLACSPRLKSCGSCCVAAPTCTP